MIVLLFKEKTKTKKIITGMSGSFFVQKWPFRDGCLFSKNVFAEPPPPILKCFVGCAQWGQVVKIREVLDPPQDQKRKI